MLKEELRIGNLFHDKKGRLCSVEEINKEESQILAISYPITSMPTKPIPLTEERIYKLGLSLEFKIRDCKIELMQHFADDEIWFFKIGDIFSVELKYVHELQNLYLDLTKNKITFVS